MAPTVEDIVEILGNMQVQNAKGSDVLKVYFDEFKSNLEQKQTEAEKQLNSISNTVSELLDKQSDTSSTQDLKALSDFINEHAQKLSIEINSQKNDIENLNNRIQSIQVDNTDKNEIIETVNSVREQVTETINKINSISTNTNDNLKEISEKIAKLASKEDNNEVKSILDNLTNNSNDIINALKFFNEKSDTLASAIQNLIASDDYIKAWEKIDTILDKTNEISAGISYLPLKADTDAINQKLDNIKDNINENVIQNSTEKFEKINSIISTMSQNLIEQQRNFHSDTESSYEEKFEQLKSLSEDIKKIENAFNLNAQNYKVLIYETLEQVKNELDTKKDDINSAIYNSQENSQGKINEKLVNLETLSLEFRNSIEGISSGLQTLNQTIASVNFTDNNKEIKQEIDKLSELSNNILNVLDDFNHKNEGLEQTINNLVTKENYEQSQQKLDTLCAQGQELIFKIDSLPAKEEINGILQDISQCVTKISKEVSSQNKTYQEKIETIKSSIDNYLQEFNFTVKESNLNQENSVNEKLLSIEATISKQADEQKEKIENFQSKVNDYLTSVEQISSNNTEKMSSSLSELTDIKSELEDISNVIATINSNTDYRFSESASALDTNIQKVITDLEDMKKAVEGGSSLHTIQGNLDSINYRFDEISNTLEEIKSNGGEKGIEIVNDLSEKVNNLKQEIDLVHTDVIGAVNSKYETMAGNIEQLRRDIAEILSYDFDKNFADLKAQIELSFLNAGSDIKDSSNQNKEAIEKLEQVYNDLHNQVSSIDESIKNNLPNNIELLKLSIESFSRNIEINLNKTSDFIDNWTDAVDGIKKLTREVQSAINKKLETYSKEIKEHISSTDGTQKTLDVIMSLKTEIENGLINIIKKQNDKSEDTQIIRNEVNTLGENLKEFVTSACENSLNKVNETITNVNTLGTMVNDNGQVTAVIENIKNILSDEITQKLNSYTMEQDKKLEKIKADINSYVYTEQVELEKKKILDEIYTIKNKNINNTEIMNIIENLEKRVNSINAKNPNNDFIQSLSDISRKSISEELQKIKNELEFCITESQNSLNNISDNVEETIETLTDVNSKLDNLMSSDDKITQTLNALHTKVDVLAQNGDDFDITYEIDDVKNLIVNQINELKSTTVTGKTQQLDECLNNLLDKINKIKENVTEVDFTKNAQDVKDSIISAIVSVFDQVSFVEETEEIKDFVEEKTDQINSTLKEVQSQLQFITAGENTNYSYTLQDVESDIAKLRLAMNDISGASAKQDIEELRTNIDKVVTSVENMKSSLTDDQIFELKNDFTKLSEDMLSISSRTNKLLLTSDESYKALSDGLDRFGGLIYQLEDKINFPDTTEINERIEKKIDALSVIMNNSVNNDQIFHQVLQYLGEWMDSASESINSISEKTGDIPKIKETLEDLRISMPNKKDIIEEFEHKFEEWNLRVDKLEMKLDNIIMSLEEHSESIVSKKMDKLEKQIAKLELNIEKLTSYVDEE